MTQTIAQALRLVRRVTERMPPILEGVVLADGHIRATDMDCIIREANRPLINELRGPIDGAAHGGCQPAVPCRSTARRAS